MKKRSILTARSTLALAAAAALGASTVDAWALGLGRLTVQSTLGEALRAEIDISSMTNEEASSLTVRIASAEAYRAAGVDYNPALSSAQVVLSRRPDGRAFLRVVSDRPVQEPFVDVILELAWSSGRLVREFTLLIDPPAARTAPPAQAAAPVAPSMAPAPAAPTARTAAPAPAPTPAPAVTAAPAAAPAPKPAKAAPAPAAEGPDKVQVRNGDTLFRIAGRTQRPGVVLDQMLVGLFRANPDAFLGSNMNRMKSGVVLSVPSTEAVKAIGVPEAREVIAAQSADFGAYRQRLAQGAPVAVAGAAPARQAKGKVQAAVEDKKQAAPTGDKLKLSTSAKASAPEAQISKATEKKDSATRVAELTRNVEDLKKLQQGTTAAQPPAKVPASAAPGVAVPVAPPVVAPAPAVAAAASAPKPAAASAPAPTPATTPAAMAQAPSAARPDVKASAVVAAASSARPASAARAPARAPAPEPSFLESIMDSPFALPGAGLLAIALAGLGYYKYRGRGVRKEGGETSFLESRVQPDSFFGASGGQRIDTTDQSAGTSSMGFSLSQLDAIGDVDPVAEADVYLAYGRDLQAEEILKEAMRTTPDRLAIRTKLLEVYAKRRDTKGFELLATQLHAITQGTGPDWEKAQEMGRQIDPENPLYKPGGRPAEVVRNGQVITEPLNATTVPQSVVPMASLFPSSGEPTAPIATEVDLDLDLEAASHADERTVPVAPVALPAAAPDKSLDFDFNAEPPTIRTKSSGTVPSAPSMDLNLGDLSLDLDIPPTVPVSKPAAAEPSLDFGGFSLSEPGALGAPEHAAPAPAEELPDEDADPIARKIELAEEFRQIGDMEGARDLLQEVVEKSSGALKAKAQQMLSDLG